MEKTYYGILYFFYKFIQVGRAGKLWSSCSAAIFTSFLIVLTIHFNLGLLFGKELITKYNLVYYGSTLIIILSAINILFFVRRQKYLEIERLLETNKKLYKKALIGFIIFVLWVTATLILAFLYQ
jgi:cell shape-determining protein MreD